MASSTPAPFQNPAARDFKCSALAYTSTLEIFHRSLPTYDKTPLHKLPTEVSDSLNLRSIHLKDESMRFGLPSFKILGASWAIYRAVCQRLSIPLDANRDENSLPVSLEELSTVARKARIRLVSCTEGNWGRAVAHTARLLGVKATIFLPEHVHASTLAKIASEGCEVRICPGDYDQSIEAAIKEAENENSAIRGEIEEKLLIMDTSWEGYEQIPEWVAEGYGTMLKEVDEDYPTASSGEPDQPDLVIVSVGVGSWAHAVVSHYKARPRGSKRTLVITVEPTSAPCLLTSLWNSEITPISTSDTIMAGMNCGTVSKIAWPLLRDGVDLALTVTDRESHEAVLELHGKCGIDAGPCGAAPFAALKKILADNLLATRGSLPTGHHEMTRGMGPKRVLLVSTEAYREYSTPSSLS